MSVSVLILDLHADTYADHLRKEFPQLRIVTARERSELPANLSDIDALIAFGVSIDDDMMRRLRGLKWIQSLATGVDHFLRCPTLSPQIPITSGRGIHGPPMRETVIYQMMALSRGVTRQVEDNKAHHWERRFWSLMAGKTAVVAGTGVVGEAIGELLQAFGMRVVGVSRTPRTAKGFDDMVSGDRLVEIAGEADYLINVLPADPENLGRFDREVFAAMKPTAYFVNAGRGQTVDDEALIACLRAGKIAGAALDVFHTQPLAPSSPFWDLPNVFITPHLGGYIVEYEELIMPLVTHNMRCFLAGRMEDMQNIVQR
jgi:phosphoglycerate dehydrogenase-like enzyme